MSKPLRMHQIKRIIELQQEGKSIRQTVRLTGLSRNTIRDYLLRIKSSGFSFSELLAMDDEGLVSVVYVDAIEKGGSGRVIDGRYEILKPVKSYYPFTGTN